MLAALALVSALAMAEAPPETDPKAVPADSFQPDPAWTKLGRSLWFDKREKRLVLRARVVLRQGPLEHLLCLKGTKEHEAILATDAVPYQIHAGLLAVGAEPGHPVRFLPRFEPPAGTPIAIEVEWNHDGQTRKADVRDWILDERAKTALSVDWVFGGSEFVDDPVKKTKVYAADDGDLFTVANFTNAILDLPIASTANDAERSFVAYTERIPPLKTPVTLYLRPRAPAKAARGDSQR